MEQELIKIINHLQNVCKVEELNISDNTLFTEACTFLRGEYACNSRSKIIVKNESSPKVVGPSERQLALLRKNESRLKAMNIELSSINTRLEASKLIDKLINKDDK
jgi:hypothetical protein